MSPTRALLRVAVVLSAALTLALTATPVAADKAPKVTLTGDGTWVTHPVGWYKVVKGRAEVASKTTYSGDLVADVRPDDASMPAAGECERGSSLVLVDADGDAPDLRVVGIGDVCGHHVQEPTNVVVYSFTGVAYWEEVGSRRLHTKDGFLDVRLAQDGRAYLFATAG